MFVEVEREDNGRWIAEVTDLPGAMAYGKTRKEAVSRARALARRVVRERECAILSESALAKDWNRPGEDDAWRNLHELPPM